MAAIAFPRSQSSATSFRPARDDTVFAPRSPVSPPTHDPQDPIASASSTKIVNFRHPGYPDFLDQNVFLSLNAWDGSDTNAGIHLGTATLACAIFACNAWDGYLTNKDAAGRHVRVEAGKDTILTERNYWFHVPLSVSDVDEAADPEERRDGGQDGRQAGNRPYLYPVCPSFSDWVFPHNDWPWKEYDKAHESQQAISVSGISMAVLNRDGRCLLSRSSDYLKRAHLCPRSVQEWFHMNRMKCFNGDSTLIGNSVVDDMRNAIALRHDIDRCFDDCRFIIARKGDNWVAHFIGTTVDLGPLYHNRPLPIGKGVSPAFLLTRFAWAILRQTKDFFLSGVDRHVKVVKHSAIAFSEMKTTYSTEQFKARFDPTRSRTPSPKKQKQSKRKQDEETRMTKRQLSESTVSEFKEVKRLRSSKSASLTSTEATPPLTSTSKLNEETKIIWSVEEFEEETRIDFLRLKALKGQRPTDPALICCDYNAAELADSMGLYGRSEWGGAHLCEECLGGEYLPLPEDGDVEG